MLMPSIFGETLFNDLFDYATPLQTAEMMKTDIRETEDAFALDIDLPGYKKENISAELKDGYLTIKATKEADKEEKDKSGKFIHRERYYGNCSRSFYVGKQIEQEDIKARFSDGTLEVMVPKKEKKAEIPEKKMIFIEG